MNKIFNVIMLLTCLFITACSGDNEPDAITPIHFEQRDYTIMFGKGAVIPFTGGSGVYELTASNPEVLGKFGIEMEAPNHSLYIQPGKTGESYLTIKDVKAETTVTLHFIVEDFYLSFRIDEIDGINTNEFFEVGREIRFIRDEDNTKPVKVIWYNNMTFQPMIVGEGLSISPAVIQIYSQWNFRCTIIAMKNLHYMNTPWEAMASIWLCLTTYSILVGKRMWHHHLPDLSL